MRCFFIGRNFVIIIKVINMKYVTLGKVINVRGLKGELKLYCSSDFSKESCA